MARNIKNDQTNVPANVSANAQEAKVTETAAQAATSATEGASASDQLAALGALLDKAQTRKTRRKGGSRLSYRVDPTALESALSNEDFPGLNNQARQIIQYLASNGPLSLDQLDKLDKEGNPIAGTFPDGSPLVRQKGERSVQPVSRVARHYLSSNVGKDSDGKSIGLVQWGILTPTGK